MKLAPPGYLIKTKQTRRCESEVLFQCTEHRMCCGLVTDELVRRLALRLRTVFARAHPTAQGIPIWKLEAALKCRLCNKGRSAPPVHMIKLRSLAAGL